MNRRARQDRGPDPAVITLYEDGPYLVRGDFEIRDQDGGRIDSRRRTVALCRCGRSKLRPLCDGTHRTARFRAAGTRETLVPSARRDAVSGEPAAVSDPVRAFDAVATAHVTVADTLAATGSVEARRVEPLLGAATALLAWQLDAAGLAHRVPRATGSDLPAARAAVGAALRSTAHLVLGDAATADQVRSLLRDAASGLRSRAQSLTSPS